MQKSESVSMQTSESILRKTISNKNLYMYKKQRYELHSENSPAKQN